MKLWVDPPSGWQFGFPKKWDSKKDKNILLWLVEEGYPQKLIDEFGEAFYTRQWRADDDQEMHKV